MSGDATVAVAIVSWNTRDLLAACLLSLRADVDRGTAEVWVVDNASTDGSADMVRLQFPWARLISRPDNIGFGPAVNLVAARTTTPFVAPANADIELGPGSLDRLLEIARADPRTGAVAPRLVGPEHETQQSVHAFPTVAATAALGLGVFRLSPRLGERLCLPRYWDPDRPRPVDWAVGAFLLVRRRAWDEVGGFDAQQWMYAEDLDLGWRLARSGWVTRYEPTAVVRHHLSAAAAQVWSEHQRARRWVAATYAWMLIRRGAPRTRAFALVSLAGAAARLVAFGALAKLRPERFGPGLHNARLWWGLHRIGLSGRGRLLVLAGVDRDEGR